MTHSKKVFESKQGLRNKRSMSAMASGVIECGNPAGKGSNDMQAGQLAHGAGAPEVMRH